MTKNNSSIWVNGRRIETKDGENISVINDQIFVNEKAYEVGEHKNIYICVVGNVNEISECSGNIYVKGNVNNYLINDSGNIYVGGQVLGDAHTNTGNVYVCGTVEGDAYTGVGNVYKWRTSPDTIKKNIREKEAASRVIEHNAGYDPNSEHSTETDRAVTNIGNLLFEFGDEHVNDKENVSDYIKCNINNGVLMIKRLWQNFIDWLNEK